MFLNFMFHAPMGITLLNQNFELPLFSVFTVVPFICGVLPCRPFVVIISSTGLVGCRGLYSFLLGLSLLLHLLKTLLDVGVSALNPTRSAEDVEITTKGLQEST